MLCPVGPAASDLYFTPWNENSDSAWYPWPKKRQVVDSFFVQFPFYSRFEHHLILAQVRAALGEEDNGRFEPLTITGIVRPYAPAAWEYSWNGELVS